MPNPTCTVPRGSQARHEALRNAGWWSSNDTVANLKRGGRTEPISPAA